MDESRQVATNFICIKENGLITRYFPYILVYATIFTGLVWLLDICIFKKGKTSKFISETKSWFPWLFAVLIIQSFIVKTFVVPSGSLEPTIFTYEFLLVNQFDYGLHLPITNTKIMSIGHPQRGDIVVFQFPGNPSVDYIKRVIGLPGDHIVYKNKILYVNGKEAAQTFIKDAIDTATDNHPVEIRQENLEGIKHLIYVWKDGGATLDYDIIVPENMYFMMGDNRDDSGDSRFWGFVSEKYLIGKAKMIFFSWDSQKYRVRWHRIGTLL